MDVSDLGSLEQKVDQIKQTHTQLKQRQDTEKSIHILNEDVKNVFGYVEDVSQKLNRLEREFRDFVKDYQGIKQSAKPEIRQKKGNSF